jgi:hypothetical protein
MATNNPQQVEAQLNQARREAQLQNETRPNTDQQDSENEDQNTTSNTKQPKEPKEKLTGIFFWMIFAANCVKDFIDLILDATVYLAFLTIITTLVVVPPTFIYLHTQGVNAKKKITGLIADFVLEFITFGAAPAMPILLIIYKASGKIEYMAKMKEYQAKLKKSQK